LLCASQTFASSSTSLSPGTGAPTLQTLANLTPADMWGCSPRLHWWFWTNWKKLTKRIQALVVLLWTRKTGTRWSWGRLFIVNSGPWWPRQQASTGEGSYKRSHECCLSLCSNLQTNVKLGPSIWHLLHFLHKILYFLHHDLNFHRFSRNGFCELSCDTFQSSQSYVYLQLVVIGHTSSLWPILATPNFLNTITSRTQALTTNSLGHWKTHSQKNNTHLSQVIIENWSHINL